MDIISYVCISYMDTYFHTLSLEYVLQMSLDKKKKSI